MLDKFKAKWNITSNWQLTVILIVFSITGSAALVVRKLVFGWIGVTAETSLWLKVPLYILILIPAYQILLIVIGTIFGQFRFFYEFQKKSFGRFYRRRDKGKNLNKTADIINHPENKNETAVLLINLGTPDAPTVGAVRRYLFQFLNDKRVIDIPWLFRKILVNLIIVPFRAPKSAKLYQQLWTKDGSPLLINTLKLQEKVQKELGNQSKVFMAMRYQNPSLRNTLHAIRQEGYSKIVVLPLFPHYASSTTSSVIEAVWDEIRNWNVIPSVQTINQFYDHPLFLDAFAERISSYNPQDYDFVLFSYHGLPTSQTDRIHPEISTTQCTCDEVMPKHGKFCYRATCYETTRLLVARLGLPEGSYSSSFQSRLSDRWLKPFSDTVLTELPRKGVKRVLVVAPSFVADCLETIVEIDREYKELFIANGGEKLTMVESLNADDKWVEAVKDMVKNYI